MPLIVVSPDVDPLPSRTQSGDGVLVGVADTDHGGVLLRANFAPPLRSVETFNDTIGEWSATGSGYASLLSQSGLQPPAQPIDGQDSLYWTRSDPADSLTRPIPTVSTAPFDREVVVSFMARTSQAGSTGQVSVVFGVTKRAGLVTDTARMLFATFSVPAGSLPPTSVSITTSSTTGTADLIVDDLTTAYTYPTAVNFYRDGNPVRGGEASPASGGIAYAYDFEVSYGLVSIWTAEPVYAIRDTLITGTASQPIALRVPDLPADYNLSLKSVHQPDLSQQVIGKWPAATRTWEGRDSLTANPGAVLMSGSWDTPVQQAETWVMETVTQDEADDLENLLTSGPLLVQHQEARHRADMFAVVKSISCDYKTSPMMPQRIWTVSFTPIESPTVTGAPLRIPFRSYSDLKDSFNTYQGVKDGLYAYDSFVFPVTQLTSGGGYGASPYGSTTYGT